jgi:hypothetical protein
LRQTRSIADCPFVSREARIIVVLFIAVMGIGLAGFGILRGLSDSGPASGVRVVVSIDPPLDAPAVEMAEQVTRDRVEEKGVETRVIPAGDHLIVEFGDADREIVREMIALIERTGALEIRAGGVAVLDPRAIARAYIDETGVVIVARDAAALAKIHEGDQLTFVFEGKTRRTAPVDHIAGNELHVQAGGLGSSGSDEAFVIADHLLSVIQAGAVHPLHVTQQEPFTRAAGFFPRAWPFVVPGLVLIVLAVLLGVSRRTKPNE